MSRPKRKSKPSDWLFRAFVLVCILISFNIIVKTKPEGRIDKNTSISTSVGADKSQSAISSPIKADVEEYHFRNAELLDSHFNKHGIEMGFEDAKSYEAAASAVISNPDALHKIEAEDGDDVYYVEETNEFVILSTDGYIRTYFLPDSGKKYYDKQ